MSVVVHLELQTARMAYNAERRARSMGLNVTREGYRLAVHMPERITAGDVERNFRASLAAGLIPADCSLTSDDPAWEIRPMRVEIPD